MRKNLRSAMQLKPKEKKIKLKIKGMNKEISLEQFQKIKALDKKKLLWERDYYKTEIKNVERIYHNRKVVYDPDIMDRIKENREKELRETVYHLHKSLYNKTKLIPEDPSELYTQILENVKHIYTKILQEIGEKKADIMQRLNLRLTDCDYKQRKILAEKMAEQETILRSLHSFTFDMQKVKENYEVIQRKISSQIDSNFDLEQKLKVETHRYNQVNSLLKEYKIRINEMVKSINEIRKENSELVYVETDNERSVNKPFNNDGIINTEGIGNDTTGYETEGPMQLSSTGYNFKQTTLGSYSKGEQSELNTIYSLKKNYNKFLNKKDSLIKKTQSVIPHNAIYSCIIDSINKLKENPNYKAMFHFNNNVNSNNNSNNTSQSGNMAFIPVQNQEFRKDFMNELFSNKKLLSSLRDEGIHAFKRTLFERK